MGVDARGEDKHPGGGHHDSSRARWNDVDGAHCCGTPRRPRRPAGVAAEQIQSSCHQNQEDSKKLHLLHRTGAVRVQRYGEVLAVTVGVDLRNLHRTAEPIREHQ